MNDESAVAEQLEDLKSEVAYLKIELEATAERLDRALRAVERHVQDVANDVQELERKTR